MFVNSICKLFFYFWNTTKTTYIYTEKMITYNIYEIHLLTAYGRLESKHFSAYVYINQASFHVIASSWSSQITPTHHLSLLCCWSCHPFSWLIVYILLLFINRRANGNRDKTVGNKLRWSNIFWWSITIQESYCIVKL